jgi:myo-inositol-1-phosphate synthase
MNMEVKEPRGRLGVLIPGMGAVATTLIAGVEAVKKGIAQPIGSLTQMGHIHLNRKDANNYPRINQFVPLASLQDIVFGGWDIYEENVYEAASRAKVLEPGLLQVLRAELEALKPMKGVFDRSYVKNLDGTHVKQAATKYDLARAVMEDISQFQDTRGCDRLVMVWCGSTEKYIEVEEVHEDLNAFEKGLRENDSRIAPSMIYAYAAIKMGIPFLNGAPNLTVDIPALVELARQTGTPIGGKDFKTRPGSSGPRAGRERLVLHQYPWQQGRLCPRRAG